MDQRQMDYKTTRRNEWIDLMMDERTMNLVRGMQFLVKEILNEVSTNCVPLFICLFPLHLDSKNTEILFHTLPVSVEILLE